MTETIAQRALTRLAEQGVRRVFGVVGREAQSILFDEAEDVEFILTRHEFAAGVMADVSARISGQPQVCVGTLGPGMTNLTTVMATAMLDRSPVLAIAAQSESRDLYPNHTHQCVDNVAVMRPLVKYCAELTAGGSLAPLIDEALAASATELVGPSFLSAPIDLLAEKDLTSASTVGRATGRQPSAAVLDGQPSVRDVAEVLSRSHRPLIVAGAAVLRAGAVNVLADFAHRHGIAIVTSYSCKGILPDDDPLKVGAVTRYMDGLLTMPALDSIFGSCDLLICLGFDYSEALRPSLWQRGADKYVASVAPYPNHVPAAFRPDVHLEMDLADFLGELDRHLPSGAVWAPPDLAELRSRKAQLLADTEEHADGIRPEQVISAVNTVIGTGTMVTDIGLYRHHAVLLGRCETPRGFITSSGCSSFGFGLPAAMGAALAGGGQPVILLAGDGGFHSNSGELETLVRLGLPVVAIVMNNQRNGLIELYQELGHQRVSTPETRFGYVDFAGLAAANGCASTYVTRPQDLTPVLRQAVESRKPTVVEVSMSYGSLTGDWRAISHI